MLIYRSNSRSRSRSLDRSRRSERHKRRRSRSLSRDDSSDGGHSKERNRRSHSGGRSRASHRKRSRSRSYSGGRDRRSHRDDRDIGRHEKGGGGKTGAQIERERANEKKRRTNMLSEYEREEFEDYLDNLTVERGRVLEAMGFALDFADMASEVSFRGYCFSICF